MIKNSKAAFKKHLRKYFIKYTVSLIGIALLGLLLIPASTKASTTISQGYITSSKLSVGSLVSVKEDNSDVVVAAKNSNVTNLIGVVITSGDTLLSVSNGGTNQVQVATSGNVPVLISNINGDISRGDPITASPIEGIGMKATNNVKIIGTAQGSLNNSNGSPESYTNTSGQKQSVLLGQVPVEINVTYFYKQPDKTVVPSAVQNIFNALAGKPVNTVPILICLGIFIITVVVTTSIIYSMIRNGIISIGRNPMSQPAVYRNILLMSLLVIGIIVIAAIAIYLVLKKF